MIFRFIKDFEARAIEIFNTTELSMYYEHVTDSQYRIVCNFIICDRKINYSFCTSSDYLNNIDTYNNCLNEKLSLMFSLIYDKLYGV